MADTSTLQGARAHARSLASAASGRGLSVPSTSATDLPSGVDPRRVVWDDRIPLGGYSSRLLPRGSLLRITDLEGDGCGQVLIYNAAASAERLNVADTVKVQWQAYLGAGALLLSDMGRVLMTMVADTSSRHDCLCGCSTRRANDERYGDGRVSGETPNARDLLCLAGAKHGLDRRDIAPNITLFKSVRVSEDGSLSFDGEPTSPTYVELRAEMDVLVLLSNTPHPLDDRDGYLGTAIRATAWLAPPPDAGTDPFRSTTPERLRAFQNTDEFLVVREP